jgi:hypothetical protein
MRALVLSTAVALAALTSQVALADDQPANDDAGTPPASGQTTEGQTTDGQATDGQPPPAGDGEQPPVADGQGGGQTVIVVQNGDKKSEEPKEKPHYGARFRNGIQLEGGVLAIPDVKVNFGSIGLTGELGAQINDLVGVYDQPAFDIVIGDYAGVYLQDAILVDFTFIDRITVGVGPEAGALIAFAPDGVAAVANYGARLHFAGYPLIGRSSSGPRRNAMQIGLDTSFLYGGFGGLTVTGAGAGATADAGFQLHAQLTFGYAAI